LQMLRNRRRILSQRQQLILADCEAAHQHLFTVVSFRLSRPGLSIDRRYGELRKSIAGLCLPEPVATRIVMEPPPRREERRRVAERPAVPKPSSQGDLAEKLAYALANPGRVLRRDK
jgi:hypothetical protein